MTIALHANTHVSNKNKSKNKNYETQTIHNQSINQSIFLDWLK